MYAPRLAIGASLALASLILISSPAAALDRPSDDRLVILPCDDGPSSGHAYDYDPATSTATVIGSEATASDRGCAMQGAVDPTTDRIYWIENGEPLNLVELDLETGESDLVAPLLLDGVPVPVIALAIDGDGNAFATSSEASSTLYSLDLATGALTVIGATGLGSGFDVNLVALAWDSVTNRVYGYDAIGRDFYAVNTETGAFALLAENVFPRPIRSMTFDSLGQVWGANGRVYTSTLADLTRLDERLSGTDFYTQSIIAVHAEPVEAPQLAETGVDGGNASMLAGFALLMVLGGALVARRRSARA